MEIDGEDRERVTGGEEEEEPRTALFCYCDLWVSELRNGKEEALRKEKIKGGDKDSGHERKKKDGMGGKTGCSRA